MSIPIRYTEPQDSHRSFHLVTHIQPHEIDYLTRCRYGNCFWTKDEEALSKEQIHKNISRLYSLIHVSPISKFTSAFVKSFNISCDIRWNYGPIALYLDIEKVKKDTIVFNGDVKNLAFKLFVQNASPKKYLRYHSMDAPIFHILVHLHKYYWNSMAHAMFKKPFFPRMVGCYFEARVFRPITPEDIEMIVIPPNLDKSELENVERLANLSRVSTSSRKTARLERRA